MGKSNQEFTFDGLAALERVIRQSEYGTLQQAVASLALFSHPSTVAQTGNKNLFRVIRARGIRRRGERDIVGGAPMEFDDNLFPIMGFLWANDLHRRKLKDVQYNHILSMSSDVSSYTSLANLAALPAFLSKLTDNHAEIKAQLYYRSKELYGPLSAAKIPEKPNYYISLNWRAPLEPVDNVEQTVRRRMSKSPKCRVTKSARELGWLYSGYKPDGTL